MIDQTVGTNTTVTLRSPPEGSFSVLLTNPSGEQVTLTNEPEVSNWNALISTVRVTWNRIVDLAVSCYHRLLVYLKLCTVVKNI